ncbi:MAG: serine/threonine protein kinase [Cystobacterineae bacterium]|nr:serine/threonine protein kinase [Cystobacterineae bacterium]
MSFQADEHTGHCLGKYELLCRMAVGGMAEIFLGFARAGVWAGKAVVLKRMLTEYEDDTEALELLLHEAKLMAGLNHPNAARVLDLEVTEGDICLVMEFIPGLNLEELVEHFQEPLPLGLTLSVIRGAALGLNHAHNYCGEKGQAAPIIHRDVTPRNIMLSFDGRSRVLDFGIARVVGANRRTTAGMVRGTSAYMSPEQATDQPLDIRTDIFSLGVVFHELLSGERLFARGKPMQDMMAVFQGAISLPSQTNRKLPRSIDNVVLRMLERSLDKRFQTMGGFVEELDKEFSTVVWTEVECLQFIQKHFSTLRAEIESMLSRIDVSIEPSTLIQRRPFEDAQTVIDSRSSNKAKPELVSDSTSKGAHWAPEALPLTPHASFSDKEYDQECTALVDSQGQPLVFPEKIDNALALASSSAQVALQDELAKKEEQKRPSQPLSLIVHEKENKVDAGLRDNAASTEASTDELLKFPRKEGVFSLRWLVLGIILMGLSLLMALGIGWWLGNRSYLKLIAEGREPELVLDFQDEKQLHENSTPPGSKPSI